MASIDDRIVSISFDNAKFEAGVAKTLLTLAKLNDNLKKVGTESGLENIEKSASKVTLSAPISALDKLKAKLHFGESGRAFGSLEAESGKVTLSGASGAIDKLKSKLAFPEAGKAFGDIQASSEKADLTPLSAAVDGISVKFGAMQVAATAALATITAKATAAGMALGKSLTIAPLQQGYEEYGLKLNSVQTIMSATGKGTKPVVAALDELNRYSDKTIYSFKDMIENIPKFTNAGVPLGKSVTAIQGIAQVAAVSGANTNEAARAMYNFGQALGQGSVKLIDWKSIELANMGTVEFKQQLIDTAVEMGTLTKTGDGMYKTQKGTAVTTKNFTTTLSDQWLTAEALTGTLAKYTDETTALGKKAFASATDIKTLTQLMDVFKEQIGSGWAQSFEAIFGDLDESKKLWKGVNEAVGGFIQTTSDARNKILKDWAKLGGRKAMIDGIGDAFNALFAVLKPLKDAFREIFPRKTGAELAEISKRFADFTERIKIGPETADKLKRTFAGLFAILSIGKQIIGGILGVFGQLLGAASSGSGGILNFTGSIGDFIVSIDEALKKGDGLTNFFKDLGDMLSAPVKLLGKLANALGSFGDSEDLTDQQQDLVDGLSPLEKVLRTVTKAWEAFVNVLRDAKEALQPILGQIRQVFGGIEGAIGGIFDNMNFEHVFQVIQTTLIGGILVAIKKGLGGGVNVDLGGGVLGNLSETLNTLTGSLKAMQKNVMAGTILKIGKAIALLAVGVLLLSLIEPKKLATAMGAIAVGLGQLIAAVALLGHAAKGPMFVTMPILAASMVVLAGAINVLAIAVFAMSRLSWEELAKGLVGVGGALVVLGMGVAFIPKSIGLVGPGIIMVAVAMNLLSVAMKVFASMDWEDIGKGLVGIAGGLAAMGVGMMLVGPSIAIAGPGLIAAAAGILLLSIAVGSFGSMNLDTLAKGIGAIAFALGLIGAALWTMPPTIALQAAGLVLLAFALNGVSVAVAIMGALDLTTIVKGLTAIGGALFILSWGLKGMIGTLPGSLALLASASALTMLVPVIGMLGSMDILTTVKGLAAMAAVLGVLALVGAYASVPITALGVAMLALAGSVVLVGAGVYLLASGLAKLGGEGSKGIAAAMVALTAFILVLPTFIINFLKGLIEVLAGIAKLAPQIVESLVKIVGMLVEVLIQSVPKLAEAAAVLIGGLLKAIAEHAPGFMTEGVKLMLAFLTGVKNNIGPFLALGAQIIVRFLNGLTVAMPQLIAAGTNTVVSFLRGITLAIPRVVASVVTLITRVLTSLAENMPRLASAGADLVTSFLIGIASNIDRVISAGGRLIRKIIQGIGEESGKIVGAATRAMGKFIQACADAMIKLTNKIANVIVNFLNGMATAIRTHGPRIGRAGRNVANALIEGLINGLDELAGDVVRKVGDIISSLPGKAMKVLGIKSPSTVFHKIGGHVMQGLTNGLGRNAPAVVRAVESTADAIVSAMDKTLKIPNILDNLVVTDPVITPVLDLTDVEKGAQAISDISNVVPIVAAASYGQATAISADQAAAQAAAAEATTAAVKEIKFEQNNYSPESLSDLEIYRRTNNQLSQAKTMLGVA